MPFILRLWIDSSQQSMVVSSKNEKQQSKLKAGWWKYKINNILNKQNTM
jgi:hypothetical protein